jgi:Rha family phage regulatory protein
MDNQLMNTSIIETIDSREVAEMIDMRHDNLMKKIRNYQRILDSSKLRSQDFFVPSTYVNNQNKEQPCYLLTKKGCEMVANKLTGEKGVIFTAKYVNRFEEMEKQIKIPKTDREILLLSVKVQEETAQRVDKLEVKVNGLENTLTIDHGQQLKLQSICKSRIISLLGGKDTPAYKELSKQLFSFIWRDFKQYFNISSYRDCLITDFENAVNYLATWTSDNNMKLKIDLVNSQTRLEI